MLSGLLAELARGHKGEQDIGKKREGCEAIKGLKIAIKDDSKRDKAFTWLSGACPNPVVPAGPTNPPDLNKFLATWGEEECPGTGPQTVGVVLPLHLHPPSCQCEGCDPIEDSE